MYNEAACGILLRVQSLDVHAIVAGLSAGERVYREFLRVPSLSVGIYRLRGGASDPQKPHGEDEVYYVLSGRGIFRVGEADHLVSEGMALFVEAGLPHRFHSISEDLTLLVFFAPAEGSAQRRIE